MMIAQNKNVHQVVRHFYFVDTAVEGSELYCCNIDGDRNSVVSQVVVQNGLDSTRTRDVKFRTW